MKKKRVIGAVIMGLALLSLVAAALPGLVGRGDLKGQRDGRGWAAVGIVEISGIITGGNSFSSLMGDAYAGSDTITAQLRQAAGDSRIKAVVLRINSPGGATAASQEIAGEVIRLRESGIRVVTSMGDMAASGAYWIASVTDKIVANPGTVTGSIGVIISMKDYQGLYGKLGIENNTFKSGPYKDMGSSERDITEEEKIIFQSMVDDTYQQFVDTVASGRKMTAKSVREIADGRVLTGRQALDLGLVDDLGGFYEAVSQAGEMAGLGRDPETLYLEPKGQWWKFFTSMGSSSGQEALFPVNRVLPQVLLICPPVNWN